MKPPYLTKSRFRVAYECPRKLFYDEQPTVYGNRNRDNDFLKALVRGGFQVGALAKIYYPAGIDLEGVSQDDAIHQTDELLKRDSVTIFEAAISSGPFLVRVDVLEKRGNHVKLIEVKSKSFNSADHTTFKTQRGTIAAEWEAHLVDVAFQTWVAKQAHPNWAISSMLMLVDKSVKATVDGLHQHFRLSTTNLRDKKVHVSAGLTIKDLGEQLLKEVPVNAEVEFLILEDLYPSEMKFDAFAKNLAEHHQNGIRGEARLAAICKSCEFRVGQEFKERGLKSGFEECWSSAGKITDKDRDRTLIFDIWNTKKTQDLLSVGKYFFDQLTIDDLKPKSKSKTERRLEPYKRQWIQIEKNLNKDSTPYVDGDGLRGLFEGVVYPLHCIDFETTMVAIPFHKGRRPYEQIAFQFSHHVLHEDGRIAHVDQYIDLRPGVFPNFEFVRKLKASLSEDRGTIFRYADHENTVLRQIRRQLVDTPQPDQEALLSFIDSITRTTASEGGIAGPRTMIDLRQLVLENYYHPRMAGSNSIKKVIPAVLGESEFLRKKYASAIYGRGKAIPSLNFDEIVWIERDSSGGVTDPYKRLPPVFADIPQSLFDDEAPLFDEESIDDGGAAMTAWGRMQFTEMSQLERTAIEKALLKYCELDTLSMIWILEYWRSELGVS